jgi:hypothetical protein
MNGRYVQVRFIPRTDLKTRFSSWINIMSYMKTEESEEEWYHTRKSFKKYTALRSSLKVKLRHGNQAHISFTGGQ